LPAGRASNARRCLRLRHDVPVRSLVVGGAGFIGSHLVDRLLADGHAVDVVDDLSRGSLANLADARAAGGALKIHNLDVASPEATSLLGMRQPDVVYHLAAVPRGAGAADALAAALAATMRLIEGVRMHRLAKVVVVIPATAIYGRPAAKSLPVKEQALEPRGVRGVIARATIDLLHTYRENDAVEFTALAMSTVYGPRQRADGGVVAALHAAAAAGRAPSIQGDGRQTRDLLYVDDAVDALARAAGRGGGLLINVGTGEQTSIRDLWRAISAGSGGEPVSAPAPVDELQRFAVSPVRARIHLGWSPWTSVEEGLRQL
jgi:UDP-glucose 4-epimerase